ncbi:hypothetical protein SUGI_0496310 [Cryptomeria japonica]|uniref:kinesin-like protein KIN-7A n=1 Tax=Cryptomeria japonica TaxID=3369 RepID=UPI002408D578|nr:kinesin-like protein KIN-7A [Cryptomeria japonica]GLJ25893.1 hypothetical protein SUGI_0496310 [Cryptomeria japonica]
MKKSCREEGEGEGKMEDCSAAMERIYVTVRLRPLCGLDKEEEEEADLTTSDWECINENTIIFKQTIPERSMYPTAYSFDRVFGCEASTAEVYKGGIKEVALSALSGLNATIFAYGQTGSGKTYTMEGITDLAVEDIYSYFERHLERVFVLKLSAMEIYNEVVKDLLSSEGSPLRLLDDPERGTVVEKLVEERVRDKGHLQKLLNLCQANRQVGETLLNEASSRSHEIIKLTIESCVREDSELESDTISSPSCLVASLNFVDLAGSERASQAFSAGTRLKEGCHINRSLLTLGTVIRKLSGSNKMKNGHIPYRDSKLTRILQHALGGNAKTAIICTMSPARRYVEQSRNTLFFASCAKEVATSAHVNVVVSDKALVKKLQKEVARLEDELQLSGRSNTFQAAQALIAEKDLQIRKMQQEIKELIQQRNSAQRQVEDLLQRIGSNQPIDRRDSVTVINSPGQRVYSNGEDKCPASEPSGIGHNLISNELHFPLQQDYCNGEEKQVSSETHYWKRPEKIEKCPASEPSGIGHNLISDELHFPLQQDYCNGEEKQVSSETHYWKRPEKIEKCPASEPSGIGHNLISNELHFPLQQDYCNGEENQASSETHYWNKTEKIEQDAFLGSEEFQQSSASTPKTRSSKESTLNPLTLVHEIRKLEYLQEELGKDASKALEALQKEVQSLHLAQSGTNKDAASAMTELRGEIGALQSKEENSKSQDQISLRSIDTTLGEEISIHNGSEDISKCTDIDRTIAALEQQLQNVQDSFENLVLPIPYEALVSPLSRTPSFMNKASQLTRSRSCRAEIMSANLSSPCLWVIDDENTPPCASEHFSERYGISRKRLFYEIGEKKTNLSMRDGSIVNRTDSFVDIKQVHNMLKATAQENISGIRSYVTELKERVAKLQYQKQLLVCQVTELETNGHVQDDQNVNHTTFNDSPRPVKSPSCWALEFDKQRLQIIELWDACCASIIHRTHFFLLFKGDPADAIYLDVEFRRLSFLRKNFSQRTLNNSNLEVDDTTTLASNIKALRRERNMLARQMQRNLTVSERQTLFKKWGIALDTKQRKLQLAQKVWTDIQDMDHIQNSANLVAKLVGCWKPGQVSKEMFELNFTPQKNNQRIWPSGRNPISSILSF